MTNHMHEADAAFFRRQALADEVEALREEDPEGYAAYLAAKTPRRSR
jgi:hypothetical protein